MLGFAGSSYALFAAVWAVLCLVSGALVTDAMLRAVPAPPALDAERPGDASAAMSGSGSAVMSGSGSAAEA